MPSDIFAITATENGKKLDAKTRQGTLTFSVTNTQERRVKTHATAQADASSNATVTVDPERVDLDPHDTKQYTVAITVPETTAAGTYLIKLSVVDDAEPGDFGSVGPAASFVVPEPIIKRCWWRRHWWIGVPVGISVLGLAAWWIWPIPHPVLRTLHEPCTDVDPAQACAPGLECVPLNAQLNNQSNECRRSPKEKCSDPSECSNYWCKQDGTCNPDLDNCSSPTDCPPAFTCVQNHCKVVNGHNCEANETCESDNCNGGICKPTACNPVCDDRTQRCQAGMCRPKPPVVPGSAGNKADTSRRAVRLNSSF